MSGAGSRAYHPRERTSKAGALKPQAGESGPRWATLHRLPCRDLENLALAAVLPQLAAVATHSRFGRYPIPGRGKTPGKAGRTAPGHQRRQPSTLGLLRHRASFAHLACALRLAQYFRIPAAIRFLAAAEILRRGRVGVAPLGDSPDFRLRSGKTERIAARSSSICCSLARAPIRAHWRCTSAVWPIVPPVGSQETITHKLTLWSPSAPQSLIAGQRSLPIAGTLAPAGTDVREVISDHSMPVASGRLRPHAAV